MKQPPDSVSQPVQQQCFSQADPLKLSQMQAFVAPCARVSGSSTPVTNTLAAGNFSKNSAMNGIDPPTPMSIGAVPSQASVKAARAASYAGPVASIWVGSPESHSVSEYDAPNGTWASRCRCRQAKALAVESPGASRIVTLARAIGVRVLLAPSTLGASMPVIVIAGWVHIRATALPEPIQET